MTPKTVAIGATLVALAGPALANEKWWEQDELVSQLAEERVLHCAETGSAGFVWQEGQAEGQRTGFNGYSSYRATLSRRLNG